MNSTSFELVWPSTHYLPGYADALRRGWSPDTLRGEVAAREELEKIVRDAEGFLSSLVDREARGAPIVRTCFIESVDYAVTRDEWTITFDLSPGEQYQGAFEMLTSKYADPIRRTRLAAVERERD